MADVTLVLEPLARPSIPKSPSMRHRMLESEIEIAAKKESNTWRSGCFVVDRRATQYFIQVIIIAVLIAFSLVQIVRLDSCEGKDFLSLLMVLIGIIVPSPAFKAGDK